MTDQDMFFLLELVLKEKERSLLEYLWDNPWNKHAFEIYADFLEEQGREKSAKWVREGFIPAGRYYFNRVKKELDTSLNIGSGSMQIPILSSGKISSGQIIPQWGSIKE